MKTGKKRSPAQLLGTTNVKAEIDLTMVCLVASFFSKHGEVYLIAARLMTTTFERNLEVSVTRSVRLET